MSWQNEFLRSLYVVAVWLVPWPTFFFAGLYLLLLLQTEIYFTESGLYWSAASIFVVSLLLAIFVKNRLLDRLRRSEAE